LWQHYSHSQLESLPASVEERLAELAAAPWLVQELARSQLRSLLGVASQVSSALEVEEEAESADSLDLRDAGDARP